MKISIAFMSFMMLAGGLMHFVAPAMYDPFIPDFLPKRLVTYGSGIVEILLGIGLLMPAYRKYAATGVFLLMLAFLPIHVLDVFKENPAIGSKMAAWIRLPVQFVLIYWGFSVKKSLGA
jgi:uncharacterized membrane protein